MFLSSIIHENIHKLFPGLKITAKDSSKILIFYRIEIFVAKYISSLDKNNHEASKIILLIKD